MKSNIVKNITVLRCAFLLFVALFCCLFLKEKDVFQDKDAMIKNDYAKMYCINKIVELIPKSAKNITVIRKNNRFRNIVISFDCCDIEKKDYVNFLKEQLSEYSAEVFMRKNKSFAIVFRPIKTDSFLQIDVDVSDQHVIIQTY